MTWETRRRVSDPLLSCILASVLLLSLLQTALVFRGGFALVRPTDALWLTPLLFAFSAIAEFSVAFLALARFHILRRATTSFWIALGFTARLIALLFYALAWPGLLPNGRSIASQLPGTSAWMGLLSNTLLGICLLAAVWNRWPGPRALAGWRWLRWTSAWAASVVLICLALLRTERYLPALIGSAGQFTPLARAWLLVNVLLMGVGAALSVRRYVATEDVLPAYIALAQIAQAFASFGILAGGNRYTLLALAGRLLSIGSSFAMLFGLLHDYVRVYRAELKRIGEIQRLNETLEQRVEERTAQLRQANRELEAFSYSVSHDLRAPVRRVQGFAQILLRDYRGKVLDEEAADLMVRMNAAGEHMSALIEDLLKLSGVAKGELTLQPAKLSEIAASVLKDLQNRDPGRSVETEIQPGLVAYADPHLMRAVLENLLGNAWKFTSKTAHPRISFGMAGDGGQSSFFVRDNGAGFDMTQAGRLFVPFQRLHTQEQFSGVGVGLAIVERIVRRHGGRVWAEGAPGQGATFYFTVGEALSRAA